ncbi:hypothetical protein A2160_02315 [Candidatus Beckwithbacteria bacterium RBG_13_42_9]|uniref:Glycosyltransferase 2-like domain-containing protein n=1 Tax=Candidatus Beckwithbacteria bacterium RBG_13_42_9 TaxID=1797457 RepID=A0A1F5E800_9BACT|nr:MAG: hypothetical protein A2160_02315 [Candidatus Beckwithbacteria bacterium RBG_13_42_9]
MDLSIIIVSHNTKGLLANLLNSIKDSEAGFYKIETIVVDNASTDRSPEMVKSNFPQVKLIINQQNLGFAVANNKGIRQAGGRYLLLLNSDTLVNNKTLKIMIDFLDQHPEYSVATCRVELPNGHLDPACHRGFPKPWASMTYFSGLEQIFPKSKLFGQYHQGWKENDQIHEVDVISGAFFMLRREIIDKVGLLDEGFFMYGEDIDWCLRIHKSGFRVAYVPNTKITHMKGQSGRRKISKDKVIRSKLNGLTEKHFWQAMKLFYQKHYAPAYPRLLKWLIFKIIDLKVFREKSL